MGTERMTRRGFVSSAAVAGAVLAADAAGAQGAPVPLAFVGCGHIHAGGYAQRLRDRKDVAVRWVWDHDAARAKSYAGTLGAQVAESPEQIWADHDVRGALILTETNRHRALVVPAAKARKHLFVEKPMGLAGKECREMAAAIDAAGVVFTTGYGMRTSPEHLFLKEQVAKGAFGRVTRARASVSHNGSLAGIFDGEFRWMADPKQAGGGGFLDLGTHMLDILMWLFGDVQRATADIRVVTARYGSCDEVGEGLIRFRSGVTATLASGWVDVANPVSLEIAGTEGHAVIVNGQLTFQSAKVAGADGAKPWTQLPAGLPQPLDQWLDAVLGKAGMPLVTAREAASRVSVMEAMYRGSTERRWCAPL